MNVEECLARSSVVSVSTPRDGTCQGGDGHQVRGLAEAQDGNAGCHVGDGGSYSDEGPQFIVLSVGAGRNAATESSHDWDGSDNRRSGSDGADLEHLLTG